MHNVLSGGTWENLVMTIPPYARLFLVWKFRRFVSCASPRFISDSLLSRTGEPTVSNATGELRMAVDRNEMLEITQSARKRRNFPQLRC